MKNLETKVYVLVEPVTLKVRYIGITKKSLKDRLRSHIYEAKYTPEFNWHKSRWINKLLKMNAKPIIKQIKVFPTREEAEKLESEMILKFKHRLVNIALDSGTFSSNGHRSAMIINSKKVYVYNFEGEYIKEYNSIIDCSQDMNIYHSTISRCLKGDYKYAKSFQFRFEKFDSIESLKDYGTGTSKKITILDNKTGEIKEIKSFKEAKKLFNLSSPTTQSKKLPALLNEKYGNRYSTLVNGKFIQSNYYNTGVIIECLEKTYNFKSQKELLLFMNKKIKSATKIQLHKFINNHFQNIKNIYLELPLIEVIQ